MKKAVEKVVVPNWRNVLKRWSFRLSTVGTGIVVFAMSAPETALHAWVLLPDDLKTFLPPNFVKGFGIALFIASNIAMFIKQKRGVK